MIQPARSRCQSPASARAAISSARGCGIAGARVVTDEARLEMLAARLHAPAGCPVVAVVKIAPEDAPRIPPARDGALLRTRMQAALARQAA